ncbi:hypothetical protein EX30DRAFT_173138 [Ascodesmis nigricans]|uniref:Uncharacterized protein n=1 Tax=Ascodesmis nigricans TaxID=341454 RepID=A0A4S2MLJ3_9PEZI|nr:hypothetical protein EX30DRAFT_173138 [Ascodesmis nigricans]
MFCCGRSMQTPVFLPSRRVVGVLDEGLITYNGCFRMRNSDIRDTARLRMRVFKLHRAGVEKSEFVFATGPVGWGMKRGMAEWGVGVGGERRAKRVKRGMEDDGGVESVVEVVSDADVMEVVEEIVVEEKFGGSSRPDSKCVSPVEETEIDDELVATVSPDLVEVEKAVEETAEVGSMEVDDPTVVEVLSVEAEAPSPIFTTDEEDSKGINMEVIQEEDIVIEEEEDATEMVAVLPVVDVSAPVSSPTVSSPAMIAETEFQFDEHPMAELERIQLLSTPPASPALSDVDETTDETETKTDSDELSMMDLQLWSPPKSDDDTDTSLPATPCPIKPLSQYENYKLIPYSYLLTSPPATPIAATRKPVERIIEFCSGFDVRPPSPPVSHFESPLAIRINREMLMELPMQETQSSQGRFGETIDEEIEDDEEDEEVEDDEHEEIEDEDEDIEEIIRSPRFYHPSPPASPVFESFPIMELEAAGLKELVVPSPMISRHHTPAPGAHDNYDYDEACAGYFDFSAAGSHDSPAIAGACPTPLRKSYGGLGIIDSPCSSKSQHLFRSSSRDSAAARETSLELTHPPLQDFAMTRKTSTRSARSGSTSFAAAYDDYTVARCNTPSREAWMCDDKGDISTTTRPELLPTPSASYGGHSRPNTPASSVGTALTRRWSSISRMSYNTNITTPPVTRPGTSMETPANGKLLIWDNEDFENQELQLCYAQNYPQELVPPVRRLMSHEESTATALENSKEDITTPELRQTTPVVVDIPQTPRSAKSSSTTSPRRLNQKRRTVSLPITREEWVIHTPVIITPPQPLTATVTTTTPEPEQDEWKVTQTAGSFQLLPLSRTIVFKPPKITATNTQTGEQVDLFSSLPKERHDDPTVISGPLTRKPSMTMATTTSTTTTAQSIPTIRITSVSPATKQRRFRSMIEYHPGHEDALEGIDELFEDLEDLAAIEKELQLQSLPPASLPPPHRRLLLAPPSPHRSRPVSSIFSSFSSSSGEEEDYDVSAVVGLENAREGIEEIPRDPEARKRGLLRRIRERARKVAEKVKEKARNSNFSSSSSASSTVKREKKVKKEKEKLGWSVVSSAANSTASLGIPTSTSAAGPGAAGFGTIVSSPSSTSLSSNPDSFISSASNSASKQSRIPRIPRLPLRRPTSPTPSVASSAPTIPVAALPKMVKAEAKAQKKREEQMARDRERIEKERRKEWEREEREREKRRREEEKEREKERERVKREEKKSAVSGGKTKIPGLGKKEKKENNEKEKKRFGFKAKTKTKVKA